MLYINEFSFKYLQNLNVHYHNVLHLVPENDHRYRLSGTLKINAIHASIIQYRDIIEYFTYTFFEIFSKISISWTKSLVFFYIQ